MSILQTSFHLIDQTFSLHPARLLAVALPQTHLLERDQYHQQARLRAVRVKKGKMSLGESNPGWYANITSYNVYSPKTPTKVTLSGRQRLGGKLEAGLVERPEPRNLSCQHLPGRSEPAGSRRRGYSPSVRPSPSRPRKSLRRSSRVGPR